MSLISKPVYNFVGWYFEQLFNNPIRTKAMTSCVIATSANLVSQKLGGEKSIDLRNTLSYSLNGLLYGGTLSHYFFLFVERVLHEDLKFRRFFQFALERLFFSPFYQGVSIYSLARFEGRDHDEAVKNLKRLYIPMIIANWKYLSLFTLLNFTVVPPVFRVFVANIIGFFWIIFLSHKRRQLAKKTAKTD